MGLTTWAFIILGGILAYVTVGYINIKRRMIAWRNSFFDEHSRNIDLKRCLNGFRSIAENEGTVDIVNVASKSAYEVRLKPREWWLTDQYAPLVIKRFSYQSEDPEDMDFAKREAEELAETIIKS